MRKKATPDPAINEEAGRIGARIAAARDRLDITNKQIADAMNVTIDAVKKMLTGASTVQYAKLKRLAQILETSPNELLAVSDGHDLDEVLAIVEASYHMIGLSEPAAHELIKLLRESLEAPLTPSARRDPTHARRIHVEIAIQRFFASTPRKGHDS